MLRYSYTLSKKFQATALVFEIMYICRKCIETTSEISIGVLHSDPQIPVQLRSYTPKLLPQPQESCAFGLENWNPPPATDKQHGNVISLADCQAWSILLQACLYSIESIPLCDESQLGNIFRILLHEQLEMRGGLSSRKKCKSPHLTYTKAKVVMAG